MFGKKLKSMAQVPSETSSEGNEVTNFEPYEDEPSEWKQLTEEQLVQTWYHLALTYENAAISVPQPESTMQWYLDAANSGNQCAKYALGKMFYRGILTEKNLFQTGNWYSKASADGSPLANYELAKMCAAGIGMDKDTDSAEMLFQQALTEFQKSEEQSPNENIELKLAVIYENGLAGTKDLDLAKHWREISNRKKSADPHSLISPDPKLVPLPYPIPIDESKASKNDIVKSVTDSLKKAYYEDVPAKYIKLAEHNPFAANDTDESLFELAMSIQANGLINPLSLNKISAQEYKIISGERRYKAIVKYLNWENIPSMVSDHVSKKTAQLQLHIANLDVREYSSKQKLQFYAETEGLLHEMKESGEYTGPIQQGIAELLGVSTHQIRKYKKIIESLPVEQQQKVIDGELSIDNAYKLTFQPHEFGRASDFEDEQEAATDTKTGRASDHEDEQEIATDSESGRTSDFENKQKAAEIGRTSDCEDEQETEADSKTGRASDFTDATNFTETVILLQTLPIAPCQECAIITGTGDAESGVIDHLELYSDTLLISVLIGNIRHPYPVSKIGSSLFVGADCLKQAMDTAAQNRLL